MYVILRLTYSTYRKERAGKRGNIFRDRTKTSNFNAFSFHVCTSELLPKRKTHVTFFEYFHLRNLFVGPFPAVEKWCPFTCHFTGFASIPLNRKLSTECKLDRHLWYADDSGAGATFDDLEMYF